MKTTRRLKVYISKPLDYPESLYETIKKYLENKNFIVTTFTGGEYTPKKLQESDVVFFLTSDLTPESKQDTSFGYVDTFENIAREQYTEIRLSKKLGKLCVTFSCIFDEVLYILETKDAIRVKNCGRNDNWGRGYARLWSRHYGEYGAEFSDFVTGYMSTEKKINHDFHAKTLIAETRYLYLLLLD